jgi:ABC-type nitrate/sulfonate/bicarbonate transport system ATPase subunit
VLGVALSIGAGSFLIVVGTSGLGRSAATSCSTSRLRLPCAEASTRA